jgi:hypothetical protein
MTKWTIADIPSLQGRLAVLTGANRVIGRHTALELPRAGSEVILHPEQSRKATTRRTESGNSFPTQRCGQRCSNWRVFGFGIDTRIGSPFAWNMTSGAQVASGNHVCCRGGARCRHRHWQRRGT